MNLLVTGAAGEIGHTMLDRLFPHGTLSVLSRRSSPDAADNRVQWALGDLQDRSSLCRACEGIDTVLHMAAMTHARREADYFAVNVAGTSNLLQASERAGAERFVYVSTRAIGESGGAYSHSKSLAEELVTDSRIRSTIIRPAEVYGGRGNDPILRLAKSLRYRSWVPILGDGSYRVSPVHVDDVVEAIARALLSPQSVGRTYILAGPEEMTYLEMVEHLERLTRVRRRRRIHVPIPVAHSIFFVSSRLGLGNYVPDQIPRLLLEKSSDYTAATRDLGFSPAKLEHRLNLESLR